MIPRLKLSPLQAVLQGHHLQFLHWQHVREAKEGRAQHRRLLVGPRVCWHRLLLGQSPEESLHATGHNRRNRIYLLLQALAQAQTKEIQLQGCLGQTQTQSQSDSTEQARPLCLWKQMRKFMCMILQKHLVHSLAPESSCSRISWLSPWSPCVYSLLTDACLGQSFLFGQRHWLWQSTSHLLCWKSTMTPDNTSCHNRHFLLLQFTNDWVTKTPWWHVSCFSETSFGNSIYPTVLSEGDFSAYQADGVISQNQTFNSLKSV